jgi:hypothetical protein
MKRLQFLTGFIILIGFFIGGCPPNESLIFYDIDNKLQEKITLSFLNDSLYVGLLGSGYVTWAEKNEYRLSLRVEVKNRFKIEHLKYFVDSINIFFNTVKMHAIDRNETIIKTGEKYGFGLYFVCSIYDVQREAKATGWSKEPTFSIDLSKFIMYDSSFINIDTIFATDPRIGGRSISSGN